MQMGPSHDPMSRASGVWSLRILIKSCLDLRLFNDELTHVLPMVVVTPVREQSPTPEERLNLFEHARATRSLRHSKPGSDLVSGLVASSTRAVSLPHEADREASFSVYKTDHPATELDQSFLLIVRTRHVVTVDITSDVASSARYTGFPAYLLSVERRHFHSLPPDH